jgi:hypothetical protein
MTMTWRRCWPLTCCSGSGSERVRLRLNGACRPPSGLTVTEAQAARFARTAMRSLLHQIAVIVADPPPPAVPERPRPPGADGTAVRCLFPEMKCKPIWAWLSPRCAPCRDGADYVS